jgi:tetratricopeptide (TPR) repeat protein
MKSPAAHLPTLPVFLLRDTVTRQLATISLRQAAREIGLSPNALRNFVGGAEPRAATRAKLERWVAARRATEPRPSVGQLVRLLGELGAELSPAQTARLGRETARFLLDAYEAYGRIVQMGGDTEPAKQAAAARARLEQDAGLMARIKAAGAERTARQYLGLAEAYAKAGRPDRAKEFCQKILTECPDTPQTVRAKELLGTLK